MTPAKRLLRTVVAVAVLLGGVGSCEGSCSDSELSGASRQIETIRVGDIEVTLGAHAGGEHWGMGLEGQSGRNLPTSIRGARDEWRPIPTVGARRGDEDLDVQNRHPSPPNWWKLGPVRTQAEAEALVAAMEVDACVVESRLLYRMSAEAEGVEYDSEWHGVYAAGSLAAHVRVQSEAEDCGAAATDMAPIVEWLAGSDGGPGRCIDAHLFGDDTLLFDCMVAGGTMDSASAEHLREVIGAGAAHDPDLEARLFGLYREGGEQLPNGHGYLSSATTTERREAFLTDQLARCVGPEPPGGCAPLVRIGRMAAQDGDADTCTRVVTAMQPVVHPRTSQSEQAMGAIVAVTSCAPDPELRPVFLAFLEIDSRLGGARDCWSHRIRGEALAESSCRVPARVAGSWLAERCGPDAVAVAERVGELHPAERIGIFGEIPDTAADGALRVLHGCAPSTFERVLEAAALEQTDEQRLRRGLDLERRASEAAQP